MSLPLATQRQVYFLQNLQLVVQGAVLPDPLLRGPQFGHGDDGVRLVAVESAPEEGVVLEEALLVQEPRDPRLHRRRRCCHGAVQSACRETDGCAKNCGESLKLSDMCTAVWMWSQCEARFLIDWLSGSCRPNLQTHPMKIVQKAHHVKNHAVVRVSEHLPEVKQASFQAIDTDLCLVVVWSACIHVQCPICRTVKMSRAPDLPFPLLAAKR